MFTVVLNNVAKRSGCLHNFRQYNVIMYNSDPQLSLAYAPRITMCFKAMEASTTLSHVI